MKMKYSKNRKSEAEVQRRKPKEKEGDAIISTIRALSSLTKINRAAVILVATVFWRAIFKTPHYPGWRLYGESIVIPQA